ncbi:hypothetical protein [Nocardioides sp. WS12]|uniref:hypothetical protein n=1 Tax=Nocardioides sp. WS12 TaxID=2486272 RepID=UPI0015FC1A6E|nr:hypothetical protein [Nocardioides sp. WS12]
MHALAVTVASVLLAVEEKAPEDDKVVAGPLGALIFGFLILSVIVIGWFLTRSLRKAGKAQEQGLYGDVPAAEDNVASDGNETVD